MPEYCIYLRKSRADLELEAKGEMETLVRHEAALIDLAKKLKLSVTHIYKEIVSGETIQARPVVQQLLDEVEQGMWAGVLVMEVERLARGDTIDQGIVARAFKIGGAKIITPVKTYDPNNEFDEEYFEFGLFMSRREYKAINRRMQRGRVASAKEGKFLGSAAPYGYKKAPVPNGKGFMLVPHEDEADAVKLIFDLYLQGKGTPLIARELDKLGIKPRHKDYWSKATIQDIIKNPVYIGKIRWSYRPDKIVRSGGELVKVRYQNPDCIFVDGLHEPLISQDVFDKAQSIRQEHNRPRVKNDVELQNPFSGLMFCGKCGSSMTRLVSSKKGRLYEAIKCTNRYCNCVSAPIFLVEQKLLRILAEWLEKYKIANKGEKVINTEAETKMLEKIKKEIEKIESQILNTYDLVEQKVYTPEIFTQRIKILTDKKTEFTAQYGEIEDKIKSMQNKVKRNLEIIPAIENVLVQYNDLSSATEKNVLLKSVLTKIKYAKDTPNRKGQLLNDNFSLDIYPKV